MKLLAESIADKPILDIQFADARNGFAAGAFGLLLLTRDGGQSWELATPRLDNTKALHLNSVRAQGERVLVAGEQGAAFLSNDGGNTFTTLTTPYRGSYLVAALLPAGGMALGGLRGNVLVSAGDSRTWERVKLATNAGVTVLNATNDGDLRIGAQSGQIYDFRVRDSSIREWVRRGPPMLTTLVDLADGTLAAGGLRGIEHLEIRPVTKP